MMAPENLPSGSPARWLKAGEWQVYCPRNGCGWAAPKNAVGGGQFGCERCHGPLRVGEVSVFGTQDDFLYVGYSSHNTHPE